jgi:Ser/Thr protein kinase RdoA (MazF antagonist)
VGRPKDHAFALRLLKRAVRQPDPFYLVKDGWVVRRLGPHCGRIELSQFPQHRDEKAILKAMGQETANLHLATSDQCAKVLRDLGKRKPDWLHQAALAMAEATEQDWKNFRSAGEGA